MFADFLKKIGKPFGAKTSGPKLKLVSAGSPRIFAPGTKNVEEIDPRIRAVTADEPKGFFGWLKSKLGRPKVDSDETTVGGHRGRAYKDMGNPDLSQENVRQWKGISPEEVQDYLGGEIFITHSSNVAAVQYHPATRQLMVEYNAKDGRGSRKYLYDDVTGDEMALFIAAGSKGSWVWTNLLGRRPVHHPQSNPKKPYRKLS